MDQRHVLGGRLHDLPVRVRIAVVCALKFADTPNDMSKSTPINLLK